MFRLVGAMVLCLCCLLLMLTAVSTRALFWDLYSSYRTADIACTLMTYKYMYLSCKSSDIDATVKRMNEDLDRICQWSKCNSLTLNPNKFKFIVLGSRQQVSRTVSRIPKLITYGEAIASIREACYLGLIMDS